MKASGMNPRYAWALVSGRLYHHWLVFGTALLAHSDMVRTTGILSGNLSDLTTCLTMIYLLIAVTIPLGSAAFASNDFDADEFRYLDFDINAASVDVRVVDANKARVIERGRVAEGMDASKRHDAKTSHPSRTRRLVFQFGSDDGKAIDRPVTVELPRRVAEHLEGSQRACGPALSGRLPVSSVTFRPFPPGAEM